MHNRLKPKERASHTSSPHPHLQTQFKKLNSNSAGHKNSFEVSSRMLPNIVFSIFKIVHSLLQLREIPRVLMRSNASNVLKNFGLLSSDSVAIILNNDKVYFNMFRFLKGITCDKSSAPLN